MQWRETNRRRQRQTNQHHGLVPPPPPPPAPQAQISGCSFHLHLRLVHLNQVTPPVQTFFRPPFAVLAHPNPQWRPYGAGDDDHEMERKPLLLRSMSTSSPATSPHRRKSSRFHDSWEVRSTSLGSLNLRRPSRLERACCDMQAAAELTERTQPLPWGLIIAVAVDNLVDGFFLGIAYIAAPRAGQIMAVATAIEMTFLGLTYSASMLKSGMTPKTLFLIAMMPFLLVFGSVAGALLGDVASTSPQVYAGFLSFGVAALIFLVTQELLLEANENLEEDNVPYINSCLFVGFWAILIIERTIG